MGSTVRSLTQQVEAESIAVGDDSLAKLAAGGRLALVVDVAGRHSGRWSRGLVAWRRLAVGLVAVGTLALALWQFLLPVTYEICSLGVRRYALGRMRLVPWTAIRAYQLRSTGVVFFQRTDPTAVDLLSSLFVPYPSDEDEVVVAVRLYLPHAVELP